MFSTNNMYKYLFMACLVCFFVLSNLAYAQDDRKIIIPDEIKGSVIAVIVLTDEEAIPIDLKGRVIPPCELCTREKEKEFGAECKEVKEQSVEICKSLTDKTVQRIEPVTILDSRGTPEYKTIYVGGKTVQVCKCGCAGLPPCHHRH